jgi:hypothetical protein
VSHTFRVSSPDRARRLVCSFPANFEVFVRDHGEPAARDELPALDRPPDVGRLVATAARPGIDLVPAGMLPGELRPRAA